MSLLIEATLLLVTAWVFSRAARLLRLPPLLGMLTAGVVLRAVHVPLPASELTLSDVSSDVRLVVLTLVLLRAGLGLKLQQFKEAGTFALRLGVVPLAGDILLVTLATHWLLGFSPASSLVVGCLLGAISPAIVIPALLELIDRRPKGRSKDLLQGLLVGATLDNIVAVIALGVALDAALAQSVPFTTIAWLLPFKVLGGALIGALGGLIATDLKRRAPASVNVALGMSVWLGGVGLVALGQLFEVSFVVGILVMGSVICSRAPTWARELSEDFRRVWDVAQYALFGLIGYAVELGPLREVGLAVVIIVLAGQLGRALAAWLATAGANRTPRERSACVLSYIPKATIQAAFAALPLDRGLPEGNVVLGAAIVAILITAPAGVIAITRGVPRLLAND